MEVNIVLLSRFLQGRQIELVIFVVEEAVQVVVPDLNDVLWNVGDVNTRQSCLLYTSDAADE